MGFDEDAPQKDPLPALKGDLIDINMELGVAV